MSEKKKRITVIDIVIIVVILAAIGVGVKMLLPKMTNGAQKQKVQFKVMLQRQDKGFADAVTVGDKVTISLTEKDGGIVKDVQAEPAKTLAYNSIEGAYANEVLPDKMDVYVTIEADMASNNLVLKTGGTPIKVGSEIPVRGKGYASTGYVIEIND